jgi:HK97 gp10 family phage protein
MKHLLGLEKLDKKLSKMEAADITQTMKQACAYVEGEAKQLCPVDDGYLRQSIAYRVESSGTQIQGVVGTTVEYAPYVHQGTGIYAVNGDGRKDRWSYQDEKGQWHSTIGQKPQPFLEKALDNNKEEVEKILQEGFRKEMGL